MRADLHVHTSASDGELSPEQVVRKAVELGIEVIAITDHDSVDGVASALEAARSFPELTVIPGVEISTNQPSGELHMLGYFLDCSNAQLRSALHELRTSRLDRARKMVARLADMGIEIDLDRVLELAAGGTVGRPHVAQAMLERGHVSTFRQAFDKYIKRDGPAYVQRKKLTPIEALKIVLKAGGLPVLAHPADIRQLGPLLSKLRKAGMVGIEVYYNGYAPKTISYLEKMAVKHDLVACGGSDYHGPGETVGSHLGSVDVPREEVERLIALAG